MDAIVDAILWIPTAIVVIVLFLSLRETLPVVRRNLQAKGVLRKRDDDR